MMVRTSLLKINIFLLNYLNIDFLPTEEQTSWSFGEKKLLKFRQTLGAKWEAVKYSCKLILYSANKEETGPGFSVYAKI